MNLARYVYKTGNAFAPGHHMDLRGPIALDHETDIGAVLFATDSQLPEVQSPNGKFCFLQIVGATFDERDAARAWDTQKFLTVMAKVCPLLVTDLDRNSILQIPDVASQIEEGTRRDGLSSALLYVEVAQAVRMEDHKLELVFGASAVDDIRTLWRGRLLHGRKLLVMSAKSRISFEPADHLSWKEDQGLVSIGFPQAALQQFADCLRPQRGSYTIPAAPGIVVRIVPSDIKDQAGNVVRTIG